MLYSNTNHTRNHSQPNIKKKNQEFNEDVNEERDNQITISHQAQSIIQHTTVAAAEAVTNTTNTTHAILLHYSDVLPRLSSIRTDGSSSDATDEVDVEPIWRRESWVRIKHCHFNTRILMVATSLQYPSVLPKLCGIQCSAWNNEGIYSALLSFRSLCVCVCLCVCLVVLCVCKCVSGCPLCV